MTPLALRVERTAEMLDLSPSSVKRLIRTGDLPAVKVGGATRVRVSDLQAFVEHLAANGSSSEPSEVTCQ